MSALDTLDRRGLSILAAMVPPAPTAPRSFAVVVLDMLTVRDEADALGVIAHRRDLTDAEETRWARLDQRMSDLRDEAKVEFRRITGVEWRVAEGVIS